MPRSLRLPVFFGVVCASLVALPLGVGSSFAQIEGPPRPTLPVEAAGCVSIPSPAHPWEVAVAGTDAADRVDLESDVRIRPAGVFVRFDLVVVNRGEAPAAFPYADLRLVAADGARHAPDPVPAQYFARRDFGFGDMETLGDGLDTGLASGRLHPLQAFFDVPPGTAAVGLELADGTPLAGLPCGASAGAQFA